MAEPTRLDSKNESRFFDVFVKSLYFFGIVCYNSKYEAYRTDMKRKNLKKDVFV